MAQGEHAAHVDSILLSKTIAVRRVTENAGKSTPGVDGDIWNTEKKWNALGKMKRSGYNPRPLRRILIPKSDGTRRPLGIPTYAIVQCRHYTC
ncbi:hypothetical protein BANRA_05396 [Escherichia coli]|nr:hypothetical protein BANRA_05396 [Escherichia coli]